MFPQDLFNLLISYIVFKFIKKKTMLELHFRFQKRLNPRKILNKSSNIETLFVFWNRNGSSRYYTPTWIEFGRVLASATLPARVTERKILYLHVNSKKREKRKTKKR